MWIWSINAENAENASTILGILLSSMGKRDRLIWVACNSGKFLVKSTYALAYEEKIEQNKGDCSNDSNCKQVWKGICQLKLPHKLRHFAWKVGQNILATKDNLKRRKISDDDECVLCGQYEETTCHLLWFCKHAHGVWESSKLALPVTIAPSQTFLDVMQNQQKWEGSQLGLTKKVISVFWGIWKDHNERRMGGKANREKS